MASVWLQLHFMLSNKAQWKSKPKIELQITGSSFPSDKHGLRQLSAQFVSCLNLLTTTLFPFFIVSQFQLFTSKFTVDLMNFQSL